MITRQLKGQVGDTVESARGVYNDGQTWRDNMRLRQKIKPRRRWWIEAGVAGFLVLLMALFLVGRMRHGIIDSSQITAEGHILESRIAVEHGLQSQDGGHVLYRIEVHVNYELRGMPQDRWLNASEVSTDRELLAAEISNGPKSCEVYWAAHHPENAKCLLK